MCVRMWLAICCIAAFWSPAVGQSLNYRAPSEELSKAIGSLPVASEEAARQRRIDPRELQRDQQGLDPIGQKKIELGQPSKGAPFVMPNSMIVQFSPDTTAGDIANYLKEKKARVLESYPTIGAVLIEADLTQYFQMQFTDKSQNDAISRGVSEAIKDYQQDGRVRSATPDVYLSRKNEGAEAEITNVLTATDIGPLAGQEASDWGISDIQANELWSLPGADGGSVFGVMDVGFALHDDVVFLDFPDGMVPDNHGNHVAGIACAKHDGKGIRGVLRNCHVRARAGDVFFRAAEGNPQLGFIVLFSQILRTLDRFVTEHDDVKTFNVSLGYNWRSNFGINPDLPESDHWRVLVQSQGTMLVTLLQIAEQKGKVIFSAAGNDSSGLVAPISARHASPFNWAAMFGRENGLANNGIIVGAHGPSGKRANFSNKDADISCPGVNILSAVAYDGQHQVSPSSYGKMSGTSMASPYCAAAHILFKLVRPGYSGIEAAKCMMASDVTTDFGTPRLRLAQALVACPKLQ